MMQKVNFFYDDTFLNRNEASGRPYHLQKDQNHRNRVYESLEVSLCPDLFIS